jgi:hypothetical protein
VPGGERGKEERCGRKASEKQKKKGEEDVY